MSLHVYPAEVICYGPSHHRSPCLLNLYKAKILETASYIALFRFSCIDFWQDLEQYSAVYSVRPCHLWNTSSAEIGAFPLSHPRLCSFTVYLLSHAQNMPMHMQMCGFKLENKVCFTKFYKIKLSLTSPLLHITLFLTIPQNLDLWWRAISSGFTYGKIHLLEYKNSYWMSADKCLIWKNASSW